MITHAGKRLVMPQVKEVFKGKFPKGHVNDVKGWNFSKAELQEAAKDGRMLAMDLDMPGGVSCSLRCKHCFNPVGELRKGGRLLSHRQILRLVDEAKDLGLRSVKIIGPGEPLEERQLLGFLDYLLKSGIQPLIFTKGGALLDSQRSRRLFDMGHYYLARELNDMGVSILYGLNSFNPELQAAIVGRAWYPGIRNLNIEMLVECGFNRYVPGEPTRLALIPNPMLKSNIDEQVAIYKWARRRNMYTVAAPPMVSGACSRGDVLQAMMPSEEELLDVYTQINLWALKNRVISPKDLLEDGISVYAGVQSCQQLGIGLFMRRDGLALRCPGDDVSIQGKYPDQSLAEIWKKSENLKIYAGRDDYGCPPKEGRSIPSGFIERVLERVKARLA
ncbi:MAG: radical SAM protein [Candidatus Micrarchaeota archaeon]